MGTLTGTILAGDGTMMAPAPLLGIVPVDPVVYEDSETRIGSIAVTLDSDGTFTIPDLPDGEYQLRARFYNPPSRAVLEVVTSTFTVSGATELTDALALSSVTGPAVTVIGIDTDTEPYYDATGASPDSVFIDTDGVPYYAVGSGGQDVYSDTDGTPVILTL